MPGRIKTTKLWRRHLPQKPVRVQRGYYSEHKISKNKIVVHTIWIILAILLIQSIFQVKYLQIDKIELKNNQDLGLEEVQETLQDLLTANKYLIFKNNNYFLLNPEPLEQVLLESYNLEAVEITKQWPDQLTVSVTEKISHFIWQKDDSLYLLDAKGALNRQISVLDDKYLILQDFRDYKPSGDQVFDANETNIINQLYLGWNDLIGNSPKLVKIVINNNWELQLYTDIGFHVKVDSAEDLNEQLGNLKKVLDENIAGVDIDYIDVRFGDKVYFK